MAAHSLGLLCLCHLLPLVLEIPFFGVSALEFNVRRGQWAIQFNMTLKTLWRCLRLHINDCPDPDWDTELSSEPVLSSQSTTWLSPATLSSDREDI